MKIAICGSIHFTEKMIEVKTKLEKLGHAPVISGFADNYIGRTDEEKEELKLRDKFERDAMREYWEQIKKSDAILVLNYDRKDIPNYVGGNTLMEIGFAHVLNKKIFLLNPVPDIEYYRSEIEATKPTIINGDLSMIR